MDNSIRIATTSEFKAIQDIDKAVVGDKMDRSDQIMQAIIELRCYISLPNGEPVGFAIFQRETFRGMDFLDLLVVKPVFQKQGFGSALIKHFKENATTELCWTSTNASNVPMISLLKKTAWIESDHVEELDLGDLEIFFFAHQEK